ncbi:peptidase M23 [Erythrobacter sp. QSSC1-22B]|nr:peptidase M23 [Erythrobacter sp. QSSC1-22B]
MRSEGQVRFVTISSRVQIATAAFVAAALLALVGTMAAMSWSQYRASTDRVLLAEREDKVADSEERLATYRDDIDEVADDLQRRQEFIEAMVASLPSDLMVPATAPGATDRSDTEAAATVEKVSMVVPEAAELAKIEARQLAFVEGMTRFADQRSTRAAAALRALGLNPDTLLHRAEREAMGGPLEKLTLGSDDDLDPRFERLGLSLARMSALETSLDALPHFKPANTRLSSGFGFRRDPFNGRGAMHSGLDFAGPQGTPIAAASKGRVSFVGRKSGYGNTVEIDHGGGLMTRYAHLSAFKVRAGQQVEAGAAIAAMGSTGRSTGSHLHFEVRIDGRAVNPRPFLETAPNVLKEVRSASPRASR